MNRIYKSDEGERIVRDRYLAFLKRWPVPNQQVRVPTSQGETFVVVSGPEGAPPLLLFHGGAANSAMCVRAMVMRSTVNKIRAVRLLWYVTPMLALLLFALGSRGSTTTRLARRCRGRVVGMASSRPRPGGAMPLGMRCRHSAARK